MFNWLIIPQLLSYDTKITCDYKFRPSDPMKYTLFIFATASSKFKFPAKSDMVICV